MKACRRSKQLPQPGNSQASGSSCTAHPLDPGPSAAAAAAAACRAAIMALPAKALKGPLSASALLSALLNSPCLVLLCGLTLPMLLSVVISASAGMEAELSTLRPEYVHGSVRESFPATAAALTCPADFGDDSRVCADSNGLLLLLLDPDCRLPGDRTGLQPPTPAVPLPPSCCMPTVSQGQALLLLLLLLAPSQAALPKLAQAGNGLWAPNSPIHAVTVLQIDVRFVTCSSNSAGWCKETCPKSAANTLAPAGTLPCPAAGASAALVLLLFGCSTCCCCRPACGEVPDATLLDR